jgi:hypothetical protein
MIRDGVFLLQSPLERLFVVAAESTATQLFRFGNTLGCLLIQGNAQLSPSMESSRSQGLFCVYILSNSVTLSPGFLLCAGSSIAFLPMATQTFWVFNVFNVFHNYVFSLFFRLPALGSSYQFFFLQLFLLPPVNTPAFPSSLSFSAFPISSAIVIRSVEF